MRNPKENGDPRDLFREGPDYALKPEFVQSFMPPMPTLADRAAAVTDAGVKEIVEKSGQKYEPDKFDYRLGPSGELQKSPKPTPEAGPAGMY
jgi:hypothetical protein